MGSYFKLNWIFFSQMQNIGNKIFCKSSDYNFAMHAKTSTSMARRLIPGIFKREALLSCTRTGKSAKKQRGNVPKPEQIGSLNVNAINTIVGEDILKFYCF